MRERVAERQQEGESERQRVMGEREHWGEAEKLREREREREREIQRLRTKEEEREQVLMRERERAREREREWEREKEHISLCERARAEERELERKREQERIREKELWERMCAADLAQGAEQALPEGWTEGWSRTKLKPYYRHLASGSTTWSRPTAALAGGVRVDVTEFKPNWWASVWSCRWEKQIVEEPLRFAWKGLWAAVEQLSVDRSQKAMFWCLWTGLQFLECL